MSDQRRALGQQGEEMACRALKKAGYKILERNWRRPVGEIDIIAERGGCRYFVEVRTKSNAFCGTAAESVNTTKQKQLLRVTRAYLAEVGYEIECEFLVIAIDRQNHSLEIIHDLLG